MANNKKADVSTPSLAYQEMQSDLELVNALMGGTETMRAAGQKYLPKEPKESKDAYNNRLMRSVLFNAFSDTVQKLVGKPFSKSVTIKDTTPENIKTWSEDIDRCGSNITSFAREVFRSGLIDGLTHILVDYPQKKAENLSLADEQAIEARPYAVNIKASNLIAWRSETVNGVEELTQIRIFEQSTVPDGQWGERQVNRIRVITKTGFELYELKDKKWKQIESGETSLGYIPLVTYYTNKIGFMSAKPPLIDLAYLNVQHWQSSSDQEHILHFIRFPLLHGAGFNSDQKQIDIGPNRMILSEDPNAKLVYVEHSGAAVDAGRQSLKDIEDKMASLGMQILTKRSGDVTATSDALDTAKSHSALQDMIRRLENTFSEVFWLMGKWVNQNADNVSGVNINQDFGLSLVSGKDEDTLLKSRMAGEISRTTYLSEMKRRNVLSEDLNIEDEMSRIETEGTTTNIITNPKPKGKTL
jgi:hypothetical protein